ncbi:MAG TPA: type II toxin-antitoxin system prevent-host-death family antitoxin [Anaerolineales bacterium]|nr:type II toxin-antitoxin system prevent-host-death family antitoxin [Anaerolineales bacterium]
MVTVGIRELKQQTSELIRLVRETGSEIQVTYHGQVVALLVPVNRQKTKEAGRAWTQLDSLAAEIGASWKKGISPARVVSEGRD